MQVIGQLQTIGGAQDIARAARFAPADGAWDDYARHGGLRAVLDPNDQDGGKNAFLHEVHRVAIKAALHLEPRHSLLDFGCGQGRFSVELAPACARVIAVDVTGGMLRRAERADRVCYLQIDGQRLPVADASIDRVLCVYVLQYAARNAPTLRRILDELARVLRPGGRVVLLEQVAASTDASGSVGQATEAADYATSALLRPIAGHAVRSERFSWLERRLGMWCHCPRRLRTWLAQRCVRRHAGGAATRGYVDWLWLLEKVT